MANKSIIIDILLYLSAFGFTDTLVKHIGISGMYERYIFYIFIGLIAILLNLYIIKPKKNIKVENKDIS